MMNEKIKKQPWKAKDGGTFYKVAMVNAIGEFRIITETYDVPKFDEEVYNNGLMCRTREQAIELASLLRKTA